MEQVRVHVLCGRYSAKIKSCTTFRYFSLHYRGSTLDSVGNEATLITGPVLFVIICEFEFTVTMLKNAL